MERAPLTHERVFDEVFAQRYAQRHQKVVEKFGHEIAQKLSVRGFRQGRIIDVGCGFGGTALVLAKEVPDCEIVGIDLSEPLLRMAEQDAVKAGVAERVAFEKADAEDVPYEDDSFDVAINIQMLHIVSNPVRMLDELERVLKPGGYLFVADIRRSWVGLLDKVFKSALTLDEIKALFRQSKLREGVFSSALLWWRFEA